MARRKAAKENKKTVVGAEEQKTVSPVCYSYLCLVNAAHDATSAQCYSFNHVNHIQLEPEQPKKEIKSQNETGATVADKEITEHFKKKTTIPTRTSKRTAAKLEQKQQSLSDDHPDHADHNESSVPTNKKQKTVAAKALTVGDAVSSDNSPSGLFTQSHSEFNLWKQAEESGLILFFYPKANTPGCTSQACNYRDNIEKFIEKGFRVFGVSADSESSLTNWKAKQFFPYDFVSDKEKKIIKLFGVDKPGANAGIIRSHVVIAKGGKIIHTKIPTPAKESWSDAYASIENL
ncbi:hypothetical protein HK100_012465 [Physocladia obscura]|uniref:thioredoxin-dependent peroxiredoxin n=1 Tax=Physocladia obscura TaxID=109957 RepID=A0AAD5T2B1_9FUNG|nr:hypothetical protein HK100_012465 [Physocladia obscura]